MEQQEYNIDYFIKKFEAIPDNEIGEVKLENHCALWHCGVQDSAYTMTQEALALADILKPGNLLTDRQKWQIVTNLNDGSYLGDCSHYGDTPKERILNRLKELKEAQPASQL